MELDTHSAMPVPVAMPMAPDPVAGPSNTDREPLTNAHADLFASLPDFDPAQAQRDPLRDVGVKVHIRKSGSDSWMYLGRASVTQEIVGAHSSRVVVRAVTSGKILATFSELCDLQAEKRGSFVIINCVEGAGVVSWSLNAMNNAETLKLLASIELACYRCRQALLDPRQHTKTRRRIERVIKDDRRRRHRRRRDEEEMISAFGKQQID